MTSFTALGLTDSIVKALTAAHHHSPTPIQEQAIPIVLDGHDLLGIAQTGTGKTAAFALPILQRLAADHATRRAPRRGCRALILSPTRELASQIAERVRTYGRGLGLTSTVVFGGVSAVPQIKALAGGIDIVIATPGRLIDHLDSGHVNLSAVETVVLDEADQMLDMGFVHAIRKITKALPAKRQSLFFSATMPTEIARLAQSFLSDPVRVEVTPVATTVEKIEQRVIMVESDRKRAMLVDLLADPTVDRVLVFTRTKHGADRVVRHLEGAGIAAAAIHGNKSQSQRERALGDFRSGRSRVLIATDIAARGIDVQAVSHVVNFDLPNVPESYVHRIGRTARAGASGIAISFCDHSERGYLRDIEKLIRLRLPQTDSRLDARPADKAYDPVDAAPRQERQRAGDNASRGPRPHRGEHPRRAEHPHRAEYPNRGERPAAPRPARDDHERPDQRRERHTEDGAQPTTYGERHYRGERPQHRAQPQHGDRPQFGDRPQRGERQHSADRPQREDRPHREDRAHQGQRAHQGPRSHQEGRQHHDGRPHREDRHQSGERPQQGNRPQQGERQPHGHNARPAKPAGQPPRGRGRSRPGQGQRRPQGGPARQAG